MKKLLYTPLVLIFVIAAFIYFNYQQMPSELDVIKSTKKWSPQITEIHTVEKINGKWLSFFSSQETLFVANLEQNIFGSWEVKEPLGSAENNLYERKGVVWGVSSVSKPKEDGTSLYFGRIIDPEIKKITLEVSDEFYEDDIPILHSNGKRFFFLTRKEDAVPFKLKALSEKNEVVESW